jgi:hypothetical protein
MAFSTDSQGIESSLFPALPFRRFHARYPPSLLEAGAKDLLRTGRWLRRRKGLVRAVGIALHPWHDQTTLWWFEQGLLNLAAAAGWTLDWYTDARYTFDRDLLEALPGRVRVHRVPDRASFRPPSDRADCVLGLFPCDEATLLARELGVPLVAFAIKNLHSGLTPLRIAPPSGTPLWHAFAGSRNFISASRNLFGKDSQWKLVGAPFPVNRYYFPIRPVSEPSSEAMLFGSKSRDFQTLFQAMRMAGIRSASALVEEEDMEDVARTARQSGISLHASPPANHLRVIELLEGTRIVANPICPPAESHYSVSTPLALGRAVVASDIPSVAPFVGSGLSTAPLADPEAWAERLSEALSASSGLPHRGALEQARERHDMSRFFASAIDGTL